MSAELMLAVQSRAARPIVTRPTKPDVGYSFDRNLTTGVTPIAVASVASHLVSIQTQNILAGYSQALKTGVTTFPVTPASAFSFGTSDFTLEFMLWLYTNASGSGQFFMLLGGVGMSLQFLSSAYGDRLGITKTDGGSGWYAFNLTRAQFLNTWRHLALVRKSGVLRAYLDGVEVGIAVETSTAYVKNGVPYTNNISGNTQLSFNLNAAYTVDVLMPEFALYKSALYTDEFSPTWPFA